MRRGLLPFVALVALSLPSLAPAATNEYAVDPVHSEVGFTVKHLVSKTPGRFEDYDGKVWLDPANVAGTLKFSATIKATSVDTRNDRRDNHLRSADFFDVENHPEITFESTSVKAKGGDMYDVTGNLTMRGVTKPITLSTELTGTATNPFTGTPLVGLDLSGTVNRKDYGINWNKALDNGGFLLGEDVAIEVHLEASVPKADK